MLTRQTERVNIVPAKHQQVSIELTELLHHCRLFVLNLLRRHFASDTNNTSRYLLVDAHSAHPAFESSLWQEGNRGCTHSYAAEAVGLRQQIKHTSSSRCCEER